MGPGLALAIASTVGEGSSLLIRIGKKVNEARKFRTKCGLLNEDAILLQKPLEKNREVIDGLDTLDRFKKNLKDIEDFVSACADWTALDVGREVFLKHKFPALREQTRALIEKFVFEIEIETLARQRAGFANVSKTQSVILQNTNVALKSLGIVRKYMTEEQQRRAAKISTSSEGIGQVRCDFKDTDPRLKLVFTKEVDVVRRNSKVGRGTLDTVGKVVCIKIEQAPHTQGYLEVYQNVQYGAGVQMFYGTLEAQNGVYAIMEDLDDVITLHATLADENFSLTGLEKLGIIYDLEICLKSLNYLTAVLKKVNENKWYPVLTGPERSRLFLVKTSLDAYDCRYEAPEFQHMGEHSWSTDIWSLGTIIWQFVFRKFPFDEANYVDPKSENATEIRGTLEDGKLPGAVTLSEELTGVLGVIRKCWRRLGNLRPTAAELTRMLQDMYTRQSFTSSAESTILVNEKESEDTRTALLQKIEKARRLNPPGVRKPLEITPDILIDEETFLNLYYEDDNWDSVKSYIVGSALFWGLANSVVQELDATPEGFQEVTERRYTLALKHLFSAADGGYTEAYHEIWRAEAALANFYKAKHETLHPTSGTTRAIAR